MPEQPTRPTTHTLPREGAPDLKFIGELVGQASNHSHQGPHQNRWAEVTVYRTSGGRYVAAVAHLTQWQDESDSHTVYVGSSPVGLLQELRDALLIEGKGGDVVDLVKRALEEGGIDAAEELEDGGAS